MTKPKLEFLTIDSLIPYARNSRTHSAEQIAQIAASIRAFGFNNPVLIDDDDGIIAGHGRVMAAHKLKMDEVPCVRLSHLSERDKRAYVIADNKLALNAGWDDDLLRLELADLHDADLDMSLLGFDADELSMAMGLSPDFDPGTEDDQGKLDEKKPVTCPSCGHEF